VVKMRKHRRIEDEDGKTLFTKLSSIQHFDSSMI